MSVWIPITLRRTPTKSNHPCLRQRLLIPVAVGDPPKRLFARISASHILGNSASWSSDRLGNSSIAAQPAIYRCHGLGFSLATPIVLRDQSLGLTSLRAICLPISVKQGCYAITFQC
ncbi:hypothetical protein COCVIDRAFT_84461 [Bipolaris victoriae FI3]|uniref:Uncharacterized protein n=1 Tax=Bipolaris victoriae (strain FI3) TaxID=930091 RepID=W7ER02_BIPV3|nr:hypothetical protein COCVIDRAFT_84461 [Bipolaris victoriae FI3]